MRNANKLAAALHVALMFSGIGVAQTTQSPPATATAPPESISAGPQATSAQDNIPHTAPIFWVSSVEIFHSLHAPQLDIIRVRGLASTEGWESAELIPMTKGIPADGILDLTFVAVAPENNTNPTAYPVIEAVFPIEPGHPFKGVRVHGAANRLSLSSLPGYAEANGHPRDCTACIGKYLVRKGAAVPADRAKDAVILEEELPQKLRVIRETDGIGSLESDPNRMTLLLNEKGEIVIALWD